MAAMVPVIFDAAWDLMADFGLFRPAGFLANLSNALSCWLKPDTLRLARADGYLLPPCFLFEVDFDLDLGYLSPL